MIYYPNSINFLTIFQKIYITIDDWENRIPFESLLFLSEIICRSQEGYNGYDLVIQKVISKIANFNTRYFKDELRNDKTRARICFSLLHFFKEIENNKLLAVEIIEKAKSLLLKLADSNDAEQSQAEEQEKDAIVLPWVSFEECITREKLDVFSKELDLEVNILHTKKKFTAVKNEIKEQEKKKQEVSTELEEKMLTMGLFFITSLFNMIEDDSNQQKDKNLLLDCLRCTRKAFSKASFKGFFMMFRYMFIKLDLLRMKGPKLNTTLFSVMFERSDLTKFIKDSYDRLKGLYSLNKDFFSIT